jgi:hypothetical protein
MCLFVNLFLTLKVYVFRGVKGYGPNLVWVQARLASMDPHMLAVLLGAARTSHETHHGRRSPHLHSWQRARALLSRFTMRFTDCL